MISFVRKKVFLFLLLIPFSELFVRFILGIGDPILFKGHPTIEYEQLPSQKVKVFHNKIFINSLGMRSDELVFPKENKKRILIYGDSIIFGGNLLSNSRLATTLLEKKLNRFKENYEIANISSGSWGPGNWLAHIKERGLYNADHVLLVINSNDFYDIPNYQSIVNNPIYPSKKPIFASIFFINRYLFPKLNSQYKRLLKNSRFINKQDVYFKKENNNFIQNQRKNSLEDLQEIINILEKNKIDMSVIQFWDKEEFNTNKPKYTNLLIRDFFNKNKINVLQSIYFFKNCSSKANNLYIDNIHPYKNLGQECLAKLMKKSLESNQTLEINK